MKIFDFTSGTNGEHLGDIKRANSLGHAIVMKGGQRFLIELAQPHGGPDDRWSWHIDATNFIDGEDAHIRPEDFGVGAICFCTGEFFHRAYHGHPDAESHWAWSVIGTTEWNREACKAGSLKATKGAA